MEIEQNNKAVKRTEALDLLNSIRQQLLELQPLPFKRVKKYPL